MVIQPILDHSKATVTISLEGLALGCFNEKTRNWEVGLIREDCHVPRVTVGKVDADGNSSEITFEVDEQHKIFISGTNVVAPEQPLFQQDPFDRKNPGRSNREDIRWIIDLEKEFNQGKELELLDTFPINELYISEPTIYANQDRRLTNMTLLDLATEPPTDKGSFGTVSAICNADIVCNEGGAVTVRVEGPLGFSIELPHIPGETHGIKIENLCPPAMNNKNAQAQPESLSASNPVAQPQPPPQPAAQSPANGPHKASDFSLYFKLAKFDTVFDLKSPAGEHGSDAVCNPALLGTRSSLFPVS
jgi:hypothetical protein